MITQDDVFRIYSEVSRSSSYKDIGQFNYAEIDGSKADDELIPMIICMELAGDVACDFGWIPKIKERLLKQFGERLRPYLMELKEHPMHGGGTGYGAAYIERSKAQVARACLDMLFDLDYQQQIKRKEHG